MATTLNFEDLLKAASPLSVKKEDNSSDSVSSDDESIPEVQDTDLVTFKNNKFWTTSLRIAQDFERDHKNVMAAISKLKTEIESHGENFSRENMASERQFYNPVFIESTYTNERGREYSMYLMNRDGFTEIVGNMATAKARAWKRRYYAAFNRMEATLKQQAVRPENSAPTITTKDITDAIVQGIAPISTAIQSIATTQQAMMSTQQSMISTQQSIINTQQSQGQQIDTMLKDYSDIKKTMSVLSNKLNKLEGRRVETVNKTIGDEVEELIFEVVDTFSNTINPPSYESVCNEYICELNWAYSINIKARLTRLKKKCARNGYSQEEIDKLTIFDAINSDPDIKDKIKQSMNFLQEKINDNCYRLVL